MFTKSNSKVFTTTFKQISKYSNLTQVNYKSALSIAKHTNPNIDVLINKRINLIKSESSYFVSKFQYRYKNDINNIILSRLYSINKQSQKDQKVQNLKKDSYIPGHYLPLSTKEELLASTTNVFRKLGIHVKWSLAKQYRPFNTDDFSALFSWLMVGNVLLIVLGTTTFFSLVIFTMNTVLAQEFVAQVIGNIMTKETGLEVVFENAVVPGWKDGVISFNKVFVSKRPGIKKSKKKVAKGNQASAMAAATSKLREILASSDAKPLEKDNDDDGNYTQYDLTIDQINVTLSFSKWLNGKGIIKSCELKGMRGVVDRRFVIWELNDDPRNYKNIHKPGDFEMDTFKMEDILVTIIQPDFSEYKFAIFTSDLSIFRKNWLFYDLINANHMSGSYDDSLFTIHKHQGLDASEDLNDKFSYNGNSSNKSSTKPWKKYTRLRIDGLDIEHLNKGVDGPFGWITSGNADIIADVMIPNEKDDMKVEDLLQNYIQEVGHGIIHSRDRPNKDDQISKYCIFDMSVQLNNVRAKVPLFTSDLTYINNAVIRPIVSYINSRKTYIPIKCRVIKKLADFDGSWTIYDSLLMDDLSAEVYDSFVCYVADEDARSLRMKKIGFWTLQVLLQFLLMGLGTIA